MKKQQVSLFLMLILVTIIVGCGRSNQQYSSAIKDGKHAIGNKDFDKAIASFEKALKVKKKDSIAKAYKEQTILYVKGLEKQAEGQYIEAISDYDKIIKRKLGYDVLVEYATSSKKESEELLKTEGVSVEKPQESDTGWSENKKYQLQEFMNAWGESMGQIYREYDPDSPVDYIGVTLPNDLLDNVRTPLLNGEPIELSWVGEKKEADTYEVVAVYSDVDTAVGAARVYFFALHNGEPYIFVTEQSVMESNTFFYFNETENDALREGFKEILNNERPEVVTNTASKDKVKNMSEAKILINNEFTETLELKEIRENNGRFELESVNREGGNVFFSVSKDGFIDYELIME